MNVIEAVLELDSTDLARMWVDLNVWRWPRDLPADLKPGWWSGDDRATTERKFGFADPLMQYARARVGGELTHREWLRYLAEAEVTAVAPEAKGDK